MSRKAERTELLSPQVGGEDFEAPQWRSEQSWLSGLKNKGKNIKATTTEITYEEVIEPGTISESRWTSRWLRWPFLVMLASLLAAIAVVLIALWRIDALQNGFNISYSSVNSYGWTYGPTAVFVIIASLWRQVDFYTRVTQPWKELARGPQTAERTVLLDYLTPFTPIGLFKALANGHVSVSLSIFGYIILKLVLLASTALLVLSPTLRESSVPATLTSDFAITNDLQSLFSFFKSYSLTSEINVGHMNINSSATHRYLGYLDGDFRYPAGLDGNYVYQTHQINASDDFNTAVLNSQILHANLSCEIATAGTNDTKLQLTSASCSVGGPNQSYIEGNVLNACVGNSCPAFDVQYFLKRVNCSETVAPPTFKGMSYAPSLYANSTFDMRYAFWVANITYDPARQQHYSDGTPYISAHREKIAAVICKPDYTLGTGLVRYDQAKNTTVVSTYKPQAQIPDFTGMMLGELVANSLYRTTEMNLTAFSQTSYDVDNPAFYLILKNLPGTQTLPYLLNNVDLLKTAAENMWNGIAANILQDYTVTPREAATDATITFVEDRLHVAPISMVLMVSALFMVIAICAYLGWSSRQPATMSNPAIIATSLDALAGSAATQHLLRNAGALSAAELAESLHDLDFSRRPNQELYFNINTAVRPGKPATELFGGPRTPGIMAGESRHAKEGWVPFCTRWYMLLLTFLLPLILIVILEIVYQTSQIHNGFADVTGNESRASIVSHYLTSIIMFLVATLYNGLDLTIALFAPYDLMSRGPLSAQRGLYFHVLGEMPVLALFHSIRAGHYSSAISNSAGLIGGLLTIVASGLWVTDHSVLTAMPAHAMIKNSFNTTWYNSSYVGDGNAAITLNKVMWEETAMPPQIRNDYVLPDVVNITQQGQNYTMQVQALRAVLDCSAVPDSSIIINTSLGNGTDVTSIAATVPLNTACQYGGDNGTTDHYTYQWSEDWLSRDQIIVSKISDIHLLTRDFSESDSWSAQSHPDNPAGCPSLMVAYAVWSNNSTDQAKHDNTTILVCSQKIQQSTLEVSYLGDAAQPTINPQTAPMLIANTTSFVTNGTPGIDSFPYRIEKYVGDTPYLTPINSPETRRSAFMDYLFYGPSPISSSAALGASGQQILIAGVQNLYAHYMSMVIHLEFRQPFSAVLQPSTQDVAGTANVYTSRLQMGYHSKCVLQVMLGIMTALGMCACWLSNIRNTLPRQPATIASTMAFLAGSDLCELRHAVLAGEVKTGGGIPGGVYSLGWWASLPSLPHEQHQGARTRRFGIDIGLANTLGYRKSVWSLRRRHKNPCKTIVR